MAKLERFREKVREYRLLVSRTQTHLANYLNLDYTELSNRLNATKKARLSHENVRAIVRALAEWGAITTQAQAKELLDLVDCPYFDEVDWQALPLSRLRPEPTILSSNLPPPEAVTNPQREREKRLKAITSNPDFFTGSRLSNFVGRQPEMAQVHQLIAQLLPTGGYLTISGPAGQGKSSLMARLIETYRQEQHIQIVQHFIPLNPGPDHQISLLRDLIAQLLLKYQLPEFYLSSESRPALRDYFFKALDEVSLTTKDGQGNGKGALILIDGLDQLEDELSGSRDLSFLPRNVPGQVVFVLATRPNDTLKPLQLLKPHYEYRLPDLSRSDFDLLLARYKLAPARPIADRFYESMQHNALYLSLVAQELAGYALTQQPLPTQEIIESVATNPDRLFSLALERLKKFRESWRDVIRPVLGVLMVAQQSLELPQLRQLLGLENDQLQDGLARLGGLVAYDENGRVQLYHLKLRDYLRQDETRPNKEYLFATDEEAQWHRRLAEWCEPLITPLIVPDTDLKAPTNDTFRQQYALQHYVRHLYGAQSWDKLWEVLDAASYGQAKLAKAYSIASYAQDLELGRYAASHPQANYEASLSLLPRLWCYSLLRCELAEWAGQHSFEASNLTALHGDEQLRAGLALAELITIPEERVDWLLQLARRLLKAGRKEEEGEIVHKQIAEILLKAYEGALHLQGEEERARLLVQLLALSDLGDNDQLNRAEELALSFVTAYDRAWSLEELVGQLLRQGQEVEAKRLQVVAAQLTNELDATTLKLLTKQRSSLRFAPSNSRLFNGRKTQLGVQEDTFSVEESARWDQARRLLAQSLAETGQWERAYQIILTLQNLVEKAASLIDLARLSGTDDAELYRVSQTKKFVDNAIEIIITLPQQDKEQQLGALVETLAAQPGNQARALELVGLIKSQREKIKALVTLARHGTDTVPASQLWQAAEKAIRQTSNHTLQAFELKELALALALAGLSAEASRLVAEIELIYLKVSAMAEVALSQLVSGRSGKEGIQRELNQLLELVPQLKNGRERTVALRSLVKVLAKSEEIEKALYYARQIPHTTEREVALQGIALELTNLGKVAKAHQLIGEFEDIGRRVICLSLMAEQLVEVEKSKEAKALLAEAQRLENRLATGPEKAEVRVRLIHSLIKLGEWASALELIKGLRTTKNDSLKLNAVAALVNGLSRAGQKQMSLELVQQAWREAKSTDQLFQSLKLVKDLLIQHPALSWELYQGIANTVNFVEKLKLNRFED